MKALKSFKLLYIFIFASASLAFLPGCTDSGVNSGDINIFSLQDDVRLGQELHQQIQQNPQEFPILQNATVQAYVESIFFTILQTPGVEYENEFPYQIRVINKDVVNAFAAPGGFVYVYTGLIKFLESEDALAAVIAHEIGHAENRHSTERITKVYGASVVLEILLGDNPGQFEALASQVLADLAFLKNSRDDEYQSDVTSFNYLLDTEWYPGASMFFFEKIRNQSSGGFLETLLSTHPLPDDRIQQMQNLINEYNLPQPEDAVLKTEQYNQIKQLL